jgi:hypothetical protein
MEEQEEAVVGFEIAQKGQSPLEGSFDIGVGTVARVGEVVESATKPVATGDEPTLGMTCGLEALGMESLGKGLDRLGQHGRWRQHPMLPGIEAGKQGHV